MFPMLDTLFTNDNDVLTSRGHDEKRKHKPKADKNTLNADHHSVKLRGWLVNEILKKIDRNQAETTVHYEV